MDPTIQQVLVQLPIAGLLFIMLNKVYGDLIDGQRLAAQDRETMQAKLDDVSVRLARLEERLSGTKTP